MRKELIVVIQDDNRDKDKVFVLKEMPAMQAEKWAARALLAVMKSGVEIPEDIAEAGLAGVAALGLRAFGGVDYADAEPLLDEMLRCVSIMPDPAKPNIRRPLNAGGSEDIEEVATLLKLRAELFTLHTGFSIPGVGSRSSPATGTPAPTPST